MERLFQFLIFFGIVILMAVMGETSGNAADVSFNVINVVKLFGVGVIAAATMVVPGVSGSMMLMLLGYYDTILKAINSFIDALMAFDMNGLLTGVGILAPFGIGVVIGIFLIAKIIEFILLEGRDSCILCDHRSDSCISNCNSVKDRLERCFCDYNCDKRSYICGRMVCGKQAWR